METKMSRKKVMFTPRKATGTHDKKTVYNDKKEDRVPPKKNKKLCNTIIKQVKKCLRERKTAHRTTQTQKTLACKNNNNVCVAFAYLNSTCFCFLCRNLK